MQSFVFMAAFVVVILTSLGFILMAKDRAEADNRYFAVHDELTGGNYVWGPRNFVGLDPANPAHIFTIHAH